MRDRRENVQSMPSADSADEAELTSLMAKAGPMRDVDGEELLAIREAARNTWRSRYAGTAVPAGSSRFARSWALLAAAAVLAAGLTLVLRLFGSGASDVPGDAVATLVRWQGSVNLRRAGNLLEATANAPVSAGVEIETGAAGRAALRLGDHVALRLDAGSRLRFEGSSRLTLLSGALYVDNSGVRPGAVILATPAGELRDVGTQFEVRLGAFNDGAAVRVRVREGEVLFARDGVEERAAVGEELRITSAGRTTRARIPLYGPDWSWVVAAAPPLAIEGIKARQFLEWIARESGWRLDLTDATAAAIADRVVLHGSIEGLALGDAPGAVLASCGLEHRVLDGVLVVTAAGAAAPER